MEIQLCNADESSKLLQEQPSDVTSAIQYTQTAWKKELGPRWEPAGNTQLFKFVEGNPTAKNLKKKWSQNKKPGSVGKHNGIDEIHYR